MSNKKQSLRKRFLKEFVLTLVQNSKSTEQSIKPPPQFKTISHTKPRNQIRPAPVQSRPVPPFGIRNQAPTHPKFLTTPLQRPKTRPFNRPTINIQGLGKLDAILKDPAVQSIECPGFGKNVLVNKSGAIQTTSITLSKDEISEILQQISDRTKIPLIPGVFKAALGNLITTAIISEYAGTRFILQKRYPLIQH